ncbi:MAG: 1-acyl-sn-glycerol-3-phosphate acyltransferase [Eubacteriales bacterium]
MDIHNNIIAFDIDGVMTDYSKFIREKGQRFLSDEVKGIYPIKNNSAYEFEEIFDVDNSIKSKFFEKYLLSYCINYPVIYFLPDMIERLYEKQYAIHIVTSRYKCNERSLIGIVMRLILKYWLWKNKIKYSKIIFCSLEHGAIEKRKYCEEHKISVMIEDCADNINELSSIMKVICMDAPYNQDCINNNIIRVKNFDYHVVYSELMNLFNGDYPYRKTIMGDDEVKKLDFHSSKEYYRKLNDYYSDLPIGKWKLEYLKKQEKTLQIVAPFIRFALSCFTHFKFIGSCEILSSSSNIYISNHINRWDARNILSMLSYSVTPHLLIKKNRSNIILNKMLAITINKDDYLSKRESIMKMVHLLNNNGNLVIFPEGTRNKKIRTEEDFIVRNVEEVDSMLNEFEKGAFLLSKITNKNLIPIGVTKRNNVWIYNVGTPIISSEFTNHEDLAIEARKRICNLILECN